MSQQTSRDWLDYTAILLAIVVGIGSIAQSWIVWTSQAQFREGFVYSTTANACSDFAGAVRNRLNSFLEISVYSEYNSLPPMNLDDSPSIQNFRESGRFLDVSFARLELVAPNKIILEATDFIQFFAEEQNRMSLSRTPLTRQTALQFVEKVRPTIDKFSATCRAATKSGKFL